MRTSEGNVLNHLENKVEMQTIFGGDKISLIFFKCNIYIYIYIIIFFFLVLEIFSSDSPNNHASFTLFKEKDFVFIVSVTL